MARVILTPYGDRPRHRGLDFTLPSRTQQHFKDECDINNILKRFTKTGTIPQIVSGFDFADVSDVPSYQEALNFISEAQAQFMELPAKIRAEFNNDPGSLLAFLDDPRNFDRAVELGLVERPKPQPEGHPTSAPAAASDQSLLDVTGRTDTNPPD